MQDTGASDVALVQTVESIIVDWLARNNKNSIELIVSHSHNHSDHIFADDRFRQRVNTQVVGTSQQAVADFFNLAHWPEKSSTFDLGNRKLQIIPLPGHQQAHIAVYDPITQILLTGDSLYPGRLYVKQEHFEEYRLSIERLAHFALTMPIKWILGTHIEMTKRAGIDYPFEAAKHLNERRLELDKSHLDQLNNALKPMLSPVQKTVFDDFILYPLN